MGNAAIYESNLRAALRDVLGWQGAAEARRIFEELCPASAPEPAPQPGDAQPVAWQYAFGNRWDFVPSGQEPEIYTRQGYKTRPLYAIPPDTSAAVRVLADALKPFREPRTGVFTEQARKAAAALADPRVTAILGDPGLSTREAGLS